MKRIKEIFGGANAEEQNVLPHIIKERGYEFFEKTPKTTMTVRLLEDLHKLGYEIKPKAKDNEVLDLVSNSDTAKKYYGLISKCEEVIFNDDEEDQTGKIADIVYEHLNIGG